MSPWLFFKYDALVFFLIPCLLSMIATPDDSPCRITHVHRMRTSLSPHEPFHEFVWYGEGTKTCLAHLPALVPVYEERRCGPSPASRLVLDAVAQRRARCGIEVHYDDGDSHNLNEWITCWHKKDRTPQAEARRSFEEDEALLRKARKDMYGWRQIDPTDGILYVCGDLPADLGVGWMVEFHAVNASLVLTRE